jgi:hypothetical protein
LQQLQSRRRNISTTTINYKVWKGKGNNYKDEEESERAAAGMCRQYFGVLQVYNLITSLGVYLNDIRRSSR